MEGFMRTNTYNKLFEDYLAYLSADSTRTDDLATFKNFLTVQCLEASILGTLCIMGMWILQIPYAVPIGILVGVTALIPVVGAFLGGIIGGVLILSVSPIKVITFAIFLLVLQQVEGNLIYPRVVGNSIGLPSIWVLVAVSVGASVGGILGMLIGVPIVSVIYTLVRKDVYKKLDEKVEEQETKVDVPL
jgi:predicted PurR-regulated permease PerM